MTRLISSIITLTIMGYVLPASALEMLTLYPGTYSSKVFDLSTSSCSKNDERTILDSNGSIQTILCEDIYRQCLFLGSCRIITREGRAISLSYHEFNEVLQRQTFVLDSLSKCPYGSGTGRTKDGKIERVCADPYFSIAADINEHLLGEVIFIPALVGLLLPTGEIHDGFLIVRDSGESLRDAGHDRYDFFTGHQDAADPQNIFQRRGLGHYDNTLAYRKATPEETKETLRKRNFPYLPFHLIEGLK